MEKERAPRHSQKISDSGYFGIVFENLKNEFNYGTLFRSAYCFNASMLYLIGRRFKYQTSDTNHAEWHIPLFECADVEAFLLARPYDCMLIGIEITEQAKPLELFVHPKRAIYALGPEDGNISKKLQEACHSILKIDTRYCLNVATAGSIVMYDRHLKLSTING